MGDYYLCGTITVRPHVPDHALDKTGFVPEDGRCGDKAVCLVPPYEQTGADFTMIEASNSDSPCNREETTADLRELVALLGPGYTFDGQMTGESADDVGDAWRLRILPCPTTDGIPARWDVVEDEALLVDPADYQVPAGPAVRFDARAAYQWLHEEVDTPPRFRAHNFTLVPAEPYDREEEHRPADWLYRILIGGNVPPAVWRLADGVEFDIEETINSDECVDGSAVLMVSVGGLRLASHHIQPEAFTTGTYGPAAEPLTQIEAVLQSLEYTAEVVNRMVEEHRTVRATDAATRPAGLYAGQLGADDTECALRTAGEMAAVILADADDFLSTRQREVIERLAALFAREHGDTED
jgi:hypothetical protein